MSEIDKQRCTWLWDVAIPLLLLLVALLPRVLALGPLTNPDELGWLDRSVAFYDALARGDWAATLQGFHPGVVPMWGFGALLCARYGLSQLQAWRADGTLPMAELARTALWFPILVSVLTVLAVYWLVRRLAGRNAALFAALLLALEPYYLAFTHAIHLDLVHASLMLVAALLWLNYLHPPRQRRYLVGSGVVGGLALLTRSASVYLVPFGLLATGGYFLADNLAGQGSCLRAGSRRWMGHAVLAWLGWLGLLGLTIFVLWPVVWVKPMLVITRLVQGILKSVEGAHPAPAFYEGEVITGDPGIGYYWLILLFRLRPLTLGLAVLNPLLLASAWRRLSAQTRTTWLLGLCYAVFYLVQMSLATHKLERYLLPVVLGLVVLAGVSLAVVAQWPAGFPGKAARLRFVALGMAVILLAVPWLRLTPYYSAYFSPVMGGGQRAAELFTVGSGLGLDQAAAYLNEKPGAEALMVPSFYHYVFQYYFRGQTQRPNEDSWAGLPFRAHYEVITSGQAQRDIYPATLDFFLPREPEYAVRINGIDYAWIYAVPRRDLAAPPPIVHLSGADFEHRVRLLGYDIGRTFDELLVTLYWQPLTTMHSELVVKLRLVDSDGHVLAVREEPPWSGNVAVLSWPGGLAVQDEHRLPLPGGLPPDDYRLALSLEQRTRDDRSWLLQLVAGDETELALGPVDLRLPEPSQVVTRGNLGDVVRLVGYEPPLPGRVQAGSSLPLTLTWECLAPMSQDYTVFVHLVGEDRRPVAQADGQPLGGWYPTSFWDAGERVVDPHLLEVPAQVPPGEYELLAGMYLLATGERLPLLDASGQAVGDTISLGKVRVTSP